MISRLRGVVISRDTERLEIETTGGVVYEVVVPAKIMERMPLIGEPVEVRTLHIVREDSATLYGFAEPQERELFRRLLGASGVGPRMAVAMLSGLSARRLARALVDKDVAALTRVPGVGKRTAERVSVELGDKVEDLAVGVEGTAIDPGAREAVQALVALGYSLTEADGAVRSVLSEVAIEDSQELIRRALARR